MRITCSSRKDEILRKKADYDARLKAYDDETQARFMKWDQDTYSRIDPVAKQVENMLRRFPALHFVVDAERAWGGVRRNSGIRIRIHCNDREKFQDDVALAWRWEATINRDGEVEKSSSSWSGLSACTPAQMESLRQTVAALELINGIDWEKVLRVDLPKYEDYDTPKLERPEPEMDYGKELQAAELDEIVGQNKAIKIHNWSGSGYNGECVWIRIVSQTPSMYTVNVASDGWGWKGKTPEQVVSSFENNNYTVRVRKSSVTVVQPIDIVDLQ